MNTLAPTALNDPELLKKLKRELNSLWDELFNSSIDLQRREQAIYAQAILLGNKLGDVKKLVGHGKWLDWLAENCPKISRRTAQRYIKRSKTASVSLLNIASANPMRPAFRLLDASVTEANNSKKHGAKPAAVQGKDADELLDENIVLANQIIANAEKLPRNHKWALAIKLKPLHNFCSTRWPGTRKSLADAQKLLNARGW